MDKKYNFNPIPLPMRELSRDYIDSQLTHINQLVHFDETVKIIGLGVDLHKLEGTDKYITDWEGSYPPNWINWWLNIAAEIWYNDEIYGDSCLISPEKVQNELLGVQLPGNHLDYTPKSLEIEQMYNAIRTSAWTMSSSQYAIAWGVKEEDMYIPIKCRGSITPTTDGLGFILITTRDEDKKRILKGIAEVR
jgi:hypothetical protein